MNRFFSTHRYEDIYTYLFRYDDKYMREDNIQGFTISLQKTIAFILFEVELSKKGKYLSYLCYVKLLWFGFIFFVHFKHISELESTKDTEEITKIFKTWIVLEKYEDLNDSQFLVLHHPFIGTNRTKVKCR